MILLERTEKFVCMDETEAELYVEKLKKETEGNVIDYKISIKETKEGGYALLTIKEKFTSLAEAKDDIGV